MDIKKCFVDKYAHIEQMHMHIKESLSPKNHPNRKFSKNLIVDFQCKFRCRRVNEKQ